MGGKCVRSAKIFANMHRVLHFLWSRYYSCCNTKSDGAVTKSFGGGELELFGGGGGGGELPLAVENPGYLFMGALPHTSINGCYGKLTLKLLALET